MKHRRLGPSLSVSALGIGCMPMSGNSVGNYGAADEAEAIRTIHRAIDLGVTFFDTAEAYGPIANEALLGRAVAGRRDELVLATKYSMRFDEAGTVLGGFDGSPANARRSCEAALRRFGTDHIDLFYLHRVDPDVPIEESVGGMAELVKEGKVLHLGLSEAAPETIRRAHAVHPIAALQSEYSLWEREVEDDILPVTRELGIGFVPFSPLGRGFLTGSIASRQDLGEGDYRLHNDPRYAEGNFDRNLLLLDKVRQVAARHGISPARIALAWLLAQGEDIVPIPGAKRRVTMEDSVAAIDVALSAADLAELAEAAPVGAAAGDRYLTAGMQMVRL
ncbi:aldo/keto reductase [Rhizorhabdus dicambivorans]|uniref:Aldo/keto reductase n=1 Tax=Rhizorhabdus dicambivorans TaxID=1850238 RepID=A0A2A4FWY4_9SPHN|nr:aldo/keto reductase [Rhizorhabdus dicambivorans]ATE65845.1 aldo/keto reductase [Rhizorhabdus dicambivorans]PCE42959.1 aldo/keto reductase [Rhizorhabdus dicambivorans]